MARAWSAGTMFALVIVFLVALLTLLVVAAGLRVVPSLPIAALYLVAVVASHFAVRGSLGSVQPGLAAVDFMLLGILAWIAIWGRARWPTFSAALQLVTVLAHAAKLTQVEVSPLAYAIMTQWTAWPSLIALATGIYLDRRAGRTF